MSDHRSTQAHPRRAIVLAASEGIGFAIADRFAAEGLQLAICSATADKIERAAAALRDRHGATVFASACDISSPAALEGWLNRALEALGGHADILVTNVGGPPSGTTHALSPEQWRHGYESIIGSVITATRLVMPGMVERQWGRVIAVGSVSAKQYLPNLALSNCFRPALSGLMKNLAMEYAAQNVLCFCIMPGNIRTARNLRLGRETSEREGVTMETIEKRWIDRSPMKRTGRPEEVAALASFLASDGCSFTTGISVPVDGGSSAGW